MRDRREVLLGLAFALGGAAGLASCGRSSEDALLASIAPKGELRFYDAGQFRIVGLLSDAIIPRTDTPGALDAGVPDYLDGMMHVWASDKTKGEHRETLAMIEAALGARFSDLTDAKRREAVARLDAQAYAAGNPDEDSLAARYRAFKSLIANIYYASEPGAAQELQYELVPGRWDGDVPLSEVGRTWYS